MESDPIHSTLSHAAYFDTNRARAMAQEHDFDIDEELTDTSRKREHTVFTHASEPGRAVLAFRGTSKRSLVADLKNDLLLSLGIQPRDFKRAEAVAAQARERYPELTVTGHSLGATKALHAAKKLGDAPAVVFNPYVTPSVKRGLREYLQQQPGARLHVHLDDDIGATAIGLPRDKIVAYTHKTVYHPHGIAGFVGAEGVLLGDNKAKKTQAKQAGKVGAVALGAAGLVGVGAALRARY